MLCVIVVMFSVLSAVGLLLMLVSLPNVCCDVCNLVCFGCLDVAALMNTVCPSVSIWLAVFLSVCLLFRIACISLVVVVVVVAAFFSPLPSACKYFVFLPLFLTAVCCGCGCFE